MLNSLDFPFTPQRTFTPSMIQSNRPALNIPPHLLNSPTPVSTTTSNSIHSLPIVPPYTPLPHLPPPSPAHTPRSYINL
jgi:hypothetical protein